MSPTFDLAAYSLGLHWINDVPNFLKHISNILTPNGIFIANFIGGASLKNLRSKLIEAEIKTNRPNFLHISPFINFDHVTLLLQQAGFKEIIVDYETIELEYASPLALMKEIKRIGESNAFMTNHNYTISKQMLNFLADSSNLFFDQVNLISIIASKNKSTIKPSQRSR